jgi:small-conductance mechanosensitive channel
MSDYLQQLENALPQVSPEILTRAAAALVVLLIAFVVYWSLVRSMATLRAKHKLSENTFVLLRRLCRWTIFPVMVLLAAQQFGMLENLWAAVTAMLAMIAIGFVAVWSVLSNTLCSVILMISRPFNIGDEVEFPGEEVGGKVIDFNLIFTTLRDGEGYLIQVPNNIFFQKPIRRKVGQSTMRLGEQADRTEHAA